MESIRNTKLVLTLKIYLLVIFIVSVYEVVVRFFFRSKTFADYTSQGLNLSAKIFGFILLAIVIYSIVLIVIIIKNRFEKKQLILPIFYLSWQLVFVVVVPIIIFSTSQSLEIATRSIDDLAIFDTMFSMLNLVLSSFMGVQLFKKS